MPSCALIKYDILCKMLSSNWTLSAMVKNSNAGWRAHSTFPRSSLLSLIGPSLVKSPIKSQIFVTETLVSNPFYLLSSTSTCNLWTITCSSCISSSWLKAAEYHFNSSLTNEKNNGMLTFYIHLIVNSSKWLTTGFTHGIKSLSEMMVFKVSKLWWANAFFYESIEVTSSSSTHMNVVSSFLYKISM